MINYPSDLLTSLEFDKIIKLVKEHCSCLISKESLNHISFIKDKSKLERQLLEIDELKSALSINRVFNIFDFEDIESVIPLLKKQDYVLELEQLLNLRSIVFQMDYLIEYCTEEICELIPLHSSKILAASFDPEIKQAFINIFNDDGSVREDASPTLKSIHLMTKSKERELDKKFNSLLQGYKSKAWLTDSAESYKNGRRVLSVNVENKRKIRGIIHDESATGKTVFIEPDAIIEINNDLFDLYNEKKKELYKIFRDLCNALGFFADELLGYQELLIALDLNKAKARFARSIRAILPEISDKPVIDLEDAVHPLLLLKNEKENKKVVPFSLLLEKNRMLLLSGPNAGGKSVTMKATGIIQLMAQYGLLVPAKRARLGIFDKIFGDIGDHQSLEDDLSTYSSRLQNMKYCIDNGDKNTLILIDEFGSGTDPKIGGAIAEAILNLLIKNRCFGVITTHYSNLKIFAYKTKDIVNGAMIFDEEGIKPTYQMRVGRPGSSFAFEIARKSGIPGTILESAKARSGGNVKAVDQLLVDLQREKKELEQKILTLSEKQDSLDKLIKNYQTLHKELDIRRKKLKLDMKEVAIRAADDRSKELDKFIKELEKKQNKHEVREESKKAKKNLKELQDESKQIREDLFYAEEIDVSKIQEGSFVKMRSSETMGKVLSIKKNKVQLIVGDLTMTVPLTELRPANEIIESNPKKSVNLAIDSGRKAHNKLDLRGFRKSEAILILEDFIDKALINNLSMLEIIHGKGNGVLRKIVNQKLKEYSDIKKVWHPADNEGGDGVSFVEL